MSSAAVAETARPRTILDIILGTNRQPQQEAPLQITAPAAKSTLHYATPNNSRNQATKRVSTNKSATKARKTENRATESETESTDLFPPAQYSGPFRGAGNQAYCVRTCDGYFFPVNYQGAKGNDRFETACQTSCPDAETQVFFMNRGGDINHATSARGVSYSSLDNALKYRKDRDPSCSCKNSQARWGKVLAPLQQMMSVRKTDIIVTEEISQRIAQGEDPAAIAKSMEKSTASVPDSATKNAETGDKRADAAAPTKASGMRSAFGERIAQPEHFSIKVDHEPTGSIAKTATTGKLDREHLGETLRSLFAPNKR